MMFITKFDIGDKVKIGEMEGRVMRISVGQTILYTVGYWLDGRPLDYTAYDWELTLVESMSIPQEEP